jgi:hypothetical protein
MAVQGQLEEHFTIVDTENGELQKKKAAVRAVQGSSDCKP